MCNKARTVASLLFCPIIVILLSMVGNAIALNWTITDIGTLGGPNVRGDYGFGINDVGQVVGISSSPTERHAFLWDRGTITDLGTLGGYERGTFSQASAINNQGQVVGYSQYYLPDGNTTAGSGFIWTSRTGGKIKKCVNE